MFVGVVVLLFFCDDVDVVGVKLKEVRSKKECEWRAGCKVGQTTQRHTNTAGADALTYGLVSYPADSIFTSLPHPRSSISNEQAPLVAHLARKCVAA